MHGGRPAQSRAEQQALAFLASHWTRAHCPSSQGPQAKPEIMQRLFPGAGPVTTPGEAAGRVSRGSFAAIREGSARAPCACTWPGSGTTMQASGCKRATSLSSGSPQPGAFCASGTRAAAYTGISWKASARRKTSTTHFPTLVPKTRRYGAREHRTQNTRDAPSFPSCLPRSSERTFWTLPASAA